MLVLQEWNNLDRGQGRILLVVWTTHMVSYCWCCCEKPNQNHIRSTMHKLKGRWLSILAFTVSALWMLTSKLHSLRSVISGMSLKLKSYNSFPLFLLQLKKERRGKARQDEAWQGEAKDIKTTNCFLFSTATKHAPQTGCVSHGI